MYRITTKNLAAEMAWRDAAILDEIRDAGYDGYVVNGKRPDGQRTNSGLRIGTLPRSFQG